MSEQSEKITFAMFPDIDVKGTIYPGWDEAIAACYNAAGYHAAENLARALAFATGAEWIWGGSLDNEQERA